MSAASDPASAAHLVLRHAASRPEHTALVYPQSWPQPRGYGRLSYGALASRVAAAAEDLHARGVIPGDRVVVLVPMSPELYVVLLAVAALGAVAVFVEPASTPREIARVVRATRPKAFVGIAKAHVLRVLDRHVARVPIVVLVGPPLLARAAGAVALANLEKAGAGAPLPPSAGGPNDPALLTFSSGSTGTPKGATRSNAFLAAQHGAIERLVARPDGAEDVHMSAFAIVLLSALCAGMTAVIPRMGRGGVNDVDGAALAAAIDELGVNVVSGSPAFLAPIIDAARRRRRPLSGVRRVVTGGAPVPVSLCEAVEGVLPGGELLVVYGSTEAEPIATIEAASVRAHTAESTRAGAGLCVGTPDPHIELKLMQPADGPLQVGPGGIAALEVADGEVGEVTVTGDHVNKRYYRNDAAERATKIVDEQGRVWHRTGDAAYRDIHGRLWIVGRTGDIVTDGERTYHPAAVEAAAQVLSFVDRAALIQSDAGEVVLVVQPVPLRSAGALAHRALSTPTSRKQAVRAALERAGVLVDRVELAPALPVDPRHRAKLDYPAIRRQFA